MKGIYQNDIVKHLGQIVVLFPKEKIYAILYSNDYLEVIDRLRGKSLEKTRAVRGSDYSPAIVLSEEKDKLVTENWRERQMDQ